MHIIMTKEKRGHDFEREKGGEYTGGFGGRKEKGELCYNLKNRAESKKANNILAPQKMSFHIFQLFIFGFTET